MIEEEKREKIWPKRMPLSSPEELFGSHEKNDDLDESDISSTKREPTVTTDKLEQEAIHI